MSICTGTHISAHGGCHLLTHAYKFKVRSCRRRSVCYPRMSVYACCTDSCMKIFRSGRVCSVWKRSSCCALAVIYGAGVPNIRRASPRWCASQHALRSAAPGCLFNIRHRRSHSSEHDHALSGSPTTGGAVWNRCRHSTCQGTCPGSVATYEGHDPTLVPTMVVQQESAAQNNLQQQSQGGQFEVAPSTIVMLKAQ